MNTIGDNLRAAREKSDMKQEYTAAKLGVTRQSLSNWENNKNSPSVEIIIKMAELYQTDYMNLIDAVPSQEKPGTITIKRSTTVLCMIFAAMIALLIYVKWKNLIFAVIAGVGLPLLIASVYSSGIFTKEYQSIPGHYFYILFKDKEYQIPYDQLKQIGTIETVTNRSIKIHTEINGPELIRMIEDKLQLQSDQFNLIDSTSIYFVRQ